MPSRYDEFHDQYYTLLSSKAGTRYERLAAIVFKAFDEAGSVIHDMKLLGDSGVAHQIDVTLERGGSRKRLLVECKDFDVSGGKVGLDIVRSFFAVVEDTKPDEAYIITCTDFTRNARMYAEAKGIKLAVLRECRESDWVGKIREVILDFHIVSTTDPKLQIKLSAAAQKKFAADLAAAGLRGDGVQLGSPVFFNAPEGRIQFNEFLHGRMKFGVNDPLGPRIDSVDLDGVTLEVEHRGPVSLEELTLSYEIVASNEVVKTGGERVAKLLVEGVGRASAVIWDDDLQRFAIDSEGRVGAEPG
jgi:hypothetical protein